MSEYQPSEQGDFELEDSGWSERPDERLWWVCEGLRFLRGLLV